MSKFSLPIALAVAALAAGCSFEPHYQRPAPPVPATFPVGGVYQSQPPSPGALPAPDLGWHEFFIDPRLQKLVELALRNNRDLRVSSLNVQEAAAQYQIVRAGLFPSINATAEEDKSRVPKSLALLNRTVSNEYSVGLGAASWELDFWGRIRSLKDQALAQYLATAQARKAAEISLVGQVGDQYLTVVAFDEQLKVTQETLTTAEASYKLAKLQFDIGTGSELDLREAEGVVEQARANLASQARSRAQAENALTLLVGEPLPADLPAALPLDSQAILSDVPAGLPSDLLTRRPDIMQAEQTLLAANANIGAARAAFFPAISLTGQLGTASLTMGSLFKPGSVAWSFSPQITLPIFDAGTNKANLDISHLEKNAAIAQYEKAIQTAFREVSDGLAARGTYDDQIKSLERFVFAEQRRLDLSELRYKNGVDSYLTVLTAQTDLYTAQQTLITARMQRLTNLVDLYQALGGGWLAHTGDKPRPADAPVEYGSASEPVAASAPAATTAAN
jgi:multidrug efflux system outer membrane protein